MRTFLLVALSSFALAGCYDLSAPSGPHREDFMRDREATVPQEQSATVCETEPCTVENRAPSHVLDLVEATASDDDADDATRRKVVMATPGKN